LNDDVLYEFGGRSLSDEGPKMAAWDRLLDTDLGTSGRSLKSVLEERMVLPFGNTQNDSGEKCSPSIGAAYSSILFGPPGTAKVRVYTMSFTGRPFLLSVSSRYLTHAYYFPKRLKPKRQPFASR